MGQIERRKRLTRIQAVWHLSDALSVIGGFLLGHLIRFSWPLAELIPPRPEIPPIRLYLVAGIASALLWILLFHALGMYRAEATRRALSTAGLLRASVLGMLLNAGVAFFYREASFSRIAAPLIWITTLILLRSLRPLGVKILGHWNALPPIRYALVGTTEAGTIVAWNLPRIGVVPHQWVGVFRRTEDESKLEGVEDLGPPVDLGPVAEQLGLDRILIALPASRTKEMEETVAQCRIHDLDYDVVPDLGFPFRGGIVVEEVGGLPVVRPRPLSLAGWNGVVKRTVDLVCSGILLILFAPVLLVCAIAVRIGSSGPVLYRQERMGRDRRVFEMLKFRSMIPDAEVATGPVWAVESDPRRTRVGEFLRKWSLDELPQFWNVFRGDMSLVGPRPERPHFVEQFHDQVPGYYGRHRIKAGLTGWAQVNGLRGNVPIEERTRYDLYYIENWSLMLDLKILFLTGKAVVTHRGA